MTLKNPRVRRSLFFENAPAAKRIRRLESQVRRNRPEMHHYTTSTAPTMLANNLNNFHLSNISQGDGINQRSGNRIRIWRIEMSGISDSNTTTHQLIQASGNDVPAISDFTVLGPPLMNDGPLGTKFNVWMRITPAVANVDSSQTFFKKTVKFPKGIIVHYDGGAGSNVVRNRMEFTSINTSGASVACYLSFRVWFTDY